MYVVALRLTSNNSIKLLFGNLEVQSIVSSTLTLGLTVLHFFFVKFVIKIEVAKTQTMVIKYNFFFYYEIQFIHGE